MEEVEAKTLLSPCKGENWFGIDWTLNLYRGCCHGCIYCDSRSACYRVHEFDRVRCKRDALRLLEGELRAKTRRGVVGMGAMSDPYNPFEREKRLTRGALELLLRHGYGAGVATKSDLAARDADLMGEIARHHPTLVKFTVTAAADELSRRVEPYVCPTSARFAALERLRAAGVFAGVLLMPVLPFLEDSEENVLGVVRRARDSGANFIYAGMGVTLRGNQRAWFYDRLDERFPGLRQRYEETYGEDYFCPSPRSRALFEAMEAACREAGILWRMEDIIAASRAPYEPQQLSLF
jgi:DNA repair photolyase